MRHRPIAAAENKKLAPGVDQQSNLIIMMIMMMIVMMTTMTLLPIMMDMLYIAFLQMMIRVVTMHMMTGVAMMITWSSMRMFLKRGRLLHHLTSLYSLWSAIIVKVWTMSSPLPEDDDYDENETLIQMSHG